MTKSDPLKHRSQTVFHLPRRHAKAEEIEGVDGPITAQLVNVHCPYPVAAAHAVNLENDASQNCFKTRPLRAMGPGKRNQQKQTADTKKKTKKTK